VIFKFDKQISGSTTLFRALLDKCLEKERFILCEMIARINTPPRLVALVPQVNPILYLILSTLNITHLL
jgi:ATP-dependent DNA helicase 2 subunit 1